MPSGDSRSIENRWYRMALLLCPPVFRREHGDEMSCDFDEARGEAAARGNGALWTLRLLMAIDLVRTAVVQWLRTGLPAIALVAASVQLVVAVVLSAMAAIARRAIPTPRDAVDADVLGVLLIAVTTVMLVGMTIAINLWVTRLNRRRRSRR